MLATAACWRCGIFSKRKTKATCDTSRAAEQTHEHPRIYILMTYIFAMHTDFTIIQSYKSHFKFKSPTRRPRFSCQIRSARCACRHYVRVRANGGRLLWGAPVDGRALAQDAGERLRDEARGERPPVPNASAPPRRSDRRCCIERGGVKTLSRHVCRLTSARLHRRVPAAARPPPASTCALAFVLPPLARAEG